MKFSQIKLTSISLIIAMLSPKIMAATNMRIACLFNSSPELVVIELAEDQPWTPTDWRFGFPVEATQDRHRFRITHYRNVTRTPGQPLLNLAQNVRPDQIIESPMFIEARMVGPMLSYNGEYQTQDQRPQSEDRRYAQLSYAIQENREEHPSRFTFSDRRINAFNNQSQDNFMTCSSPQFYSADGESVEPPAANPEQNTRPQPTTK